LSVLSKTKTTKNSTNLLSIFLPYALSSFDDAADDDGVGDDTVLRCGIIGDVSSESGRTNDFNTFSNISPITINDGSTIY